MVNYSTTIVYNYYNLISRLTPNIQLELIELISKSLKEMSLHKTKSIEHLFGAWIGDETAEELIENIRISRVTNRNIEEL